MEIWENKGTPERGQFIACFSEEEKKRIQRARSVFLGSSVRRSMPKESVGYVKNSLSKFVGNNVFCYEDENGTTKHESIVDAEAVADTRDVLILQAQSSLIERKRSTDLAAELLAGAVNVLRQIERSKPVGSQEDLKELILSR